MTVFGLSIVGILAATFIGMLLGALWYSPLLFGPHWLRAINKTAETVGDSSTPMIGSIIASAMSAVGVAIIFAAAEVNSLTTGLYLGLTLGVLIIFPALLSDNLFCGWGKPLLLIQSGYRAMSILAMSVVMTFFI